MKKFNDPVKGTHTTGQYRRRHFAPDSTPGEAVLFQTVLTVISSRPAIEAALVH